MIEITHYLELTQELANPEISVTRRTEILTELTEDYKTVHTDVANFQKQQDENKKQIEDLTHSHSVMFRKLGMTVTETEEEGKKAEYSETITLEDIEKGL